MSTVTPEVEQQSSVLSEPAAEQSVGGRTARDRPVLNFLARYGTLVGLVLMVVYFTLAAPNVFLTRGNLTNIVNQSSLTAIIACGLTIVLVVGEFDLSIGYMASLAGVISAGLIVRQGLPVWLAFVAAVAVGLAVGLANALLVTKAQVNAVIATLGLGTVLVGISFGYTSGTPIAQGLPNGFLDLTLGRFAGIPNPIVYMALISAGLWVVLNRTDLGEHIQAVGGNREAARLSGINVDAVKTAAFLFSAGCAAVTGVLLASLSGSGSVSAGDSYLLDSFAAVFLGSATLRDGEFHIVGTLIGVLIINTGFNGLNLLGAPTFYQYVLKGGLLVVAVALSSVARRYART